MKVKLSAGEQTWCSLPEIRAAELQCMQFTLALLNRHESEMYVTVELEKNTASFDQSNNNQKQRLFISRQSSETITKHTEESEKIADSQIWKCKSQDELNFRQTKQRKEMANDAQEILKTRTPKLPRAKPFFHPASDKLYRNDERRLLQDNLKSDRQRSEPGEKFNQVPRSIIRNKLVSSSSLLSTHNNKSKQKQME